MYAKEVLHKEQKTADSYMFGMFFFFFIGLLLTLVAATAYMERQPLWRVVVAACGTLLAFVCGVWSLTRFRRVTLHMVAVLTLPPKG